MCRPIGCLPVSTMSESSVRTVLVTGASSGIGLAICRRLLGEGHGVIGVARDFSKSPLHSPAWSPEVVDLAELSALPERLQAIANTYPAIDGVVCCAGRGRFGSLEEFAYTDIRALMDLNFTSQAYVARAFVPLMKRRSGGDLIFIGSEAALSGGRRGAVYSASKFALRGLAQALREECGRSGVRVCVINPGMVRTGFFDSLNFAPGDDPENYLLPEDVAEAAALVLGSRPETVFDEINLSPLKRVVRFRPAGR